MDRKKLYTLLHIGKENLGWDEDMYRDVLRKHGAAWKNGKVSATTLSVAQIEDVLSYMKRQGFRVTPSAKKAKSTPVDKIITLWHELYHYGIIEDGSVESLNRLVKRLTGMDSVFFLKTNQLAQPVICALENWGGNNERFQ
jgi:phage gp16-like protein